MRDECDKIFEALDMAENLGVKSKEFLKSKKSHVDFIELQLTRFMRKWPTSKRR